MEVGPCPFHIVSPAIPSPSSDTNTPKSVSENILKHYLCGLKLADMRPQCISWELKYGSHHYLAVFKTTGQSKCFKTMLFVLG